MRNRNNFMARQIRKGKRVPVGKDRAPKIDRGALHWRLRLGLSIENFDRWLLAMEEV